MRSRLISAVLASFVLIAAPCARAGNGDVSFCNEFPHKLYIAIAYLETDVNNYLSRGWLEVETGKCYIFDTAIRVPTFYYRAESETYRDGKHKVKMEWGNDKQFAVRDANFQSYNAEKAYSGMRLAGFSKAPDSEGSPITAIVTFTETGGSNITMPAPEKPEAQSGGTGGAAAQAAQHAPAPSGAASSAVGDKDAAGSSGGDNTPAADNAGNGRDSGPRQ
ncbi:MAG: DUF1036 domain-containing protein [Methyloceanibacter sp.]